VLPDNEIDDDFETDKELVVETERDGDREDGAATKVNSGGYPTRPLAVRTLVLRSFGDREKNKTKELLVVQPPRLITCCTTEVMSGVNSAPLRSLGCHPTDSLQSTHCGPCCRDDKLKLAFVKGAGELVISAQIRMTTGPSVAL
jgi:hypothetical protein